MELILKVITELLCIQSECGKIRTRITPNTDIFYAVLVTALMGFGRDVDTMPPLSSYRETRYGEKHSESI